MKRKKTSDKCDIISLYEDINDIKNKYLNMPDEINNVLHIELIVISNKIVEYGKFCDETDCSDNLKSAS